MPMGSVKQAYSSKLRSQCVSQWCAHALNKKRPSRSEWSLVAHFPFGSDSAALLLSTASEFSSSVTSARSEGSVVTYLKVSQLGDINPHLPRRILQIHRFIVSDVLLQYIAILAID